MLIDILNPTSKMIKIPEDHHQQLTRFCENRGIENVSSITVVEDEVYPTYIIHADEDHLVEIIDNRAHGTCSPLRKNTNFEAPQGMTKDIKYVLTRTPITEILEEEDKNIFKALIEASNRLMFLEHMENHPSPCPQCQSKNIYMAEGDFTCRDCGMTATFEITFKKIPLGDETDCNRGGDVFPDWEEKQAKLEQAKKAYKEEQESVNGEFLIDQSVPDDKPTYQESIFWNMLHKSNNA